MTTGSPWFPGSNGTTGGSPNQARDVGQRRGLRPGRLSRLGARAEAHPAAAGRGVPGARAAAGAMGWRGG